LAIITPPTELNKPGIFINRNFANLWLAQFISFLGDQIFDLTIVIWIATSLARRPDGSPEPWAALAVSGVTALIIVPILTLGPIAGVFVDRWNKRHTMQITDLARAATIMILLLVTNTTPSKLLPFVFPIHIPKLVTIYVIVFINGCLTRFFAPSRFALIGEVVPEKHRAQASSLTEVVTPIASILGPPLAAPLFLTFGAQLALTMNALSFLVSFALITAVRLPAQSNKSDIVATKPSFGHEFIEGLRFSLHSPVIRVIMIAATFTALGSGAILSLAVFFVTNSLHANVRYFGFFDALLGIGAIIGAILASIYAQKIGLARTFNSSFLILGVLVILLSRLNSFIPGLITVFFIGLGQSMLNIPIGPMILNATPQEAVGRTISIMTTLAELGSLLSVVIAGFISSTLLNGFHKQILNISFGQYDTIYLGCGIIILIGAIYTITHMPWNQVTH
jgi:MFS family permease